MTMFDNGSQDPVCGMRVNPTQSRFSHEHAGETYYFCCGGCQTAFKSDPTQFLTNDVAALAPAAAVDPVCGMTVDPATSTVSHEHADATYYFCCDGCPDVFAGDTAMYEDKAHHQLVMTGQYEQTKCPKTGRPLNPATTIDVAGVDVDFCCNGCKAWANESEGDELVAKIFNAVAFGKGFEKKAE